MSAIIYDPTVTQPNSPSKQLFIVGYEVDQELYEAAGTALALAATKAKQAGISVQVTLYNKDFMLAQTAERQLSLFDKGEQPGKALVQTYDRILKRRVDTLFFACQ